MHGTPYGTPPPRRPMPGPPTRRQRSSRQGWVVAGAVLAALLVLGGIAAAVSPDEQATPAAAPSTAPTARDTRETWEHIPTDRQKAFTAYLRRLDPGLTPTSPGARPRPLRRAVSVCWDVYAGKPAATVLRSTAARYDGGQASVPEGSVKARKILAAVKRWICSARELRAVYDQRHP